MRHRITLPALLALIGCAACSSGPDKQEPKQTAVTRTGPAWYAANAGIVT